MKGVIRLGDATNHGGVVLGSFSSTNLNGRPISGKGHMVACPKCKGVFPIVEGSANYKIRGTPVALDGMKTACGAQLIASETRAKIHG